MSRHGYDGDSDLVDDHMVNLWYGALASARRGKRGQKFFRELLDALDTMPVKELHAGVFDDPDGKVCALGALARVKGVDTTKFDPEEDYAAEVLAKKFDVSDKLTRETIYWNDEGGDSRPILSDWVHENERDWYGRRRVIAYVTETPDQRWQRMRDWVANQIKEPT